MRAFAMTALAAAMLVASPAVAKTGGQASGANATAGITAAAPKAADSEKKVCKRLAASGTRMTERVCLTKDEWKKVEEQN